MPDDEYKVWIPMDLPDLNEVLDQRAGHWANYSKWKKRVHRDMAYFMNTLPKGLGRIRLTCIWLVGDRRKDPDNIIFAKKFILDSLVEHEIIANDGWKQVVAPMLDFWGLREDGNDTGVWVVISKAKPQTHEQSKVLHRALQWHRRG